MSTVMSLANKHIVAGIVRAGRPDSKRGLPRASYMKRFHVSKWTHVQYNRTKKTLTVVHALVPERYLFAYCVKVKQTFLSWLPPHNNTLCSHSSLQGCLSCDLDRGAAYFINTMDYAERSSAELTFGLRIRSYNETVPTGRTGRWKPTHTPHMDDYTRSELGQPPRRARVNGPSVSRATVDASREGPQPSTSSERPVSAGRPTDLYMCRCCYEWTHVCVFNCGHIACENCILKSVKASETRRCFYCNIQWKWYRFVRMGSVSKDVICSACDKAKMYIMPCGHASCACPNPVCSKCTRGETVRLYLAE